MGRQFGRHRCVDDCIAIRGEVASLLPVDQTQEETALPPAHVEKVLGVLEDDDLVGMRTSYLLDAPGGVWTFSLEPLLQDCAGQRGEMGAGGTQIVAHPVAIGKVVIDHNQHRDAFYAAKMNDGFRHE